MQVYKCSYKHGKKEHLKVTLIICLQKLKSWKKNKDKRSVEIVQQRIINDLEKNQKKGLGFLKHLW